MLTAALKTNAAGVWMNDLRGAFLDNNAVIYAINIRTFGAKDTNGNGLIDGNEESGTFLNAISRLDELQGVGINTLHLLPITPVGKTKALGTAGSLYAISSFNELNPQLDNPKNKLSVAEEAAIFIEECHKRKMRVIVDLPSCGAYDLYLKHPEYFKKDKSQNPIIPTDWTDVRLFDTGVDGNLNMDVYNLYKSFVDLMVSLEVDGIRADVATIKPFEFWKKLITYTRAKNPQFLYLAEASDSWREPPSEFAVFTPYNKLLEAGFDGYYGSFFNFKNFKTAKEFYNLVNFNLRLSKKYGTSVIGSFSTHDELSPILINGEQFSKMIIWLNSTLPLNPYYVDGFITGDNYAYGWANRKSMKSFTDDDYYFVHKGKFDIFNFSAKPDGGNRPLFEEFLMANRFRAFAGRIITGGSFKPLGTNLPEVFAYARVQNKVAIVVVGNLDFKAEKSAIVNVPSLTPEMNAVPVKINNIPVIAKGKIKTELNPGEIQVMLFEGLSIK